MLPDESFSSGLSGVAGGYDFNLLIANDPPTADERTKLENDRNKLVAEKEKLEKQLSVFSEKTPAAVTEKTAAAIADAARKIEVIAFRLGN